MTPRTFPFATRRASVCALSLALLLTCGGAWADDCPNATSTVQMNECMAQAAKTADAKLNRTYQHVLATLKGADDDAQQSYPASTKASLVEAQRAWVRYRDADCMAVFHQSQGGSIRTVAQLSCVKERTEQRTRELEVFLRQP
jgi:uncharacterized protein YecT (DUF1311 family)